VTVTAEELAKAAVDALIARGETVATAESLTGGMVADAFVRVPGTSAVYRGGVIPYATLLKHELLGVDADLLEHKGPVDPDVALQMAAGVSGRLGASWGVSTTGVAGPEPQDGVPPGVVYVAVVGGPGATRRVERLDLPGDRVDVRRVSTEQALNLLVRAIGDAGTARGR
jgi:nicotinamide-nucleotide amidase